MSPSLLLYQVLVSLITLSPTAESITMCFDFISARCQTQAGHFLNVHELVFAENLLNIDEGVCEVMIEHNSAMVEAVLDQLDCAELGDGQVAVLVPIVGRIVELMIDRMFALESGNSHCASLQVF